MRPDLSELHIYIGILFTTAGVSIAAGIGPGLIVLGILLLLVGVAWAVGQQRVAAKAREPRTSPFEPIMTAGPEPDETA